MTTIEIFSPSSPDSLNTSRKAINEKIGPNAWEKVMHEEATRQLLRNMNANGMTKELEDSFIMGIVAARMKRNNNVVTSPVVNKSDNKLRCLLCYSTDVTVALTMAPKKEKEKEKDLGPDDITLVSFICRNHANNPELTQKDGDAALEHFTQWRHQTQATGKYPAEVDNIQENKIDAETGKRII